MERTSPRLIYIDMDYRAERVLLVRSDAKQTEIPFPAPPGTVIAGARFFPDLPCYLVRLSSGKEILFELPDNGEVTPLRGRNVVYLDQNAWSRLARVRDGISTGDDDEDIAGDRVLELVKQDRLILPFSGATINETSHWSKDDERLRLGEFILEFSRGWQMRDPLALRREEIVRALRRRTGEDLSHAVPNPWTVLPVAISGLSLGPEDEFLSKHPELLQLTDAMIGISVMVETLLSESPLPRADPEGWRDHWSQLSRALRDSPATKEARVKGALGAAFLDAREEVRFVAEEIGYGASDAAEWLGTHAFKDYAHMPSFGLACEVTRLKLGNGANWHMNDLADIFYYVQSAGYADAVVGERSFTSYVRNAQNRLGRPQTAFRSFKDLMASRILVHCAP